MTLLHQAAQKAVEARQYEDSDPGDCPELNMSNYDHNDVAALNAWAVQAWHCIARQTRELAALQQQPEPVAHAPQQMSESEIHSHSWWCPHCLKDVPPEMVTKDGEHYLESGGCGRAVRAEAASPSTTQQQEAGNGWRSIETVPKDGREIILREGSRVGAACWVKWPGTFYSDGTPKDDGGEGWTVGYDGDEWADPTHWQAMPATPSTPESAEKDDAGGGKACSESCCDCGKGCTVGVMEGGDAHD